MIYVFVELIVWNSYSGTEYKDNNFVLMSYAKMEHNSYQKNGVY